MRQKGGVLAGLFFGVIFSAVGFGVAFYVGKPILNNANASSDWPSVSGVITTSRVTTSRSDGSTMYSADVVYDYTVEGQKYTGDNVFFGGNYSTSSSSGINKIVNRYPKGKTVKVFYDPNEVGNSVLEPGTTWSSYMVYGVGLLFLVIGVLVLLSSITTILGGGVIIAAAITALVASRKKSNPQVFSATGSGENESRYLPH